MNHRWHFTVRRACDRMRDSANDAFFTAESLENISEALVREGVQNSLDAARREINGVRQVNVRIAFQPNAPVSVQRFLMEQFASAEGNFARGLSIPSITLLLNSGTGYLVFEDFGTRGLTGDVNESRLDYAEKNAFFSFFRAEGRSAKSGESLGRWGIGKQVFPTSSKLHAFFGLTVRTETPTRVLMGSAVVRTHSYDGKDYQPDAWFGCREKDDDPVQPITSARPTDAFIETFGLKRGTEPGLSVIVPAIDERVNSDDLRRSIVRSFFWPILLGELVVDLETPEKTWRIDAETLPFHRELLPAAEAAVIEFATWASVAKPADIVTLSDEAATKPQWSQVGDQLLTEPKLDEIRIRLETDHRVAVKIPVRVRPKFDNREEELSFFTVYLATCRDSGHRPIFLRDGIVITDIRTPLMSGTRSLVIADDAPLAGLLGDSEGVNHTQWQKDSPKFHNRYIYGPDTIKFVSRSVFEITQRLHATETKGDPRLLLDIFYLPTDEGSIEPKKKPEPGKPDVSPPLPPPLPPPKPKRFVLVPVKGGFVVKPGNAALDIFPIKIRIEARYAVRRGNAIKRWASDDFCFVRLPLRLEPKPNGTVITKESENTLELEIRKPIFEFGIVGFDTNRDLVVRAIELKGDSETNV